MQWLHYVPDLDCEYQMSQTSASKILTGEQQHQHHTVQNWKSSDPPPIACRRQCDNRLSQECTSKVYIMQDLSELPTPIW